MRRSAGCAAISAALLLSASTVAVAQYIAPGHQERVLRVEASLIRGIQISGHTPERYYLTERMRHYNVPGVSIAVMEEGEIVWALGYGVRDRSTGEPVTPETLFQAASISKPVAAMGMLRLVEAGELDLDEDVNRRLTSWQVPENDFTEAVTLRRIASHTAGLTVHGFPGYPRSEAQPTTAGVLSGMGNTDSVVADIEPGSSWRYSGGGFTVLQQLIEDVTGESFYEFMYRTVLQPAGMESSTFAQPLPRNRWGEAATGYRENGAPVAGDWHVYPEMAAAGLWTTPTDLLRLAREVQLSLRGESNRILSREMTAEMLTPIRQGYSLGFSAGTGPDARFGHGGANEGFRALWTAYQHRGSGIAIMTNGDGGSPLAQELLLAVAEEYGWRGIGPDVVDVFRYSEERRRALGGIYSVPTLGIEFLLEFTEDGLVELTSAMIPGATLVPTSETELLDIMDGSVLTIEWDGDRVVEMRSRGILILPGR